MSVAIAILGITGKMGKNLLTLSLQDPDARIVSGTTHPDSSQVDMDAGMLLNPQQILNIHIYSDAKSALKPCAIAIDFSAPEVTEHHVLCAHQARKALVIGTTGQSADTLRTIEKSAQDIPILLSPNFSLGIHLCLKMAALCARTLLPQCEIAIYETHHIHKKDRPSGTALALEAAIHAEEDEKKPITIHSTRLAETIGEHRVVFDTGFESIEIKHTAHTRAVFAQGALLAAKWLIQQPPGLYSLKDVL